jgi:ATP-binding cassette subfamily B protein
VKQADLLILDDSASALDYLTESRLYHAVTKSNRETGRTLIVISQRIAAIRSADRILVLDEGRMVGFGTHRRLLTDCPEYKEIVDSQLFGKEAT